MAELQYLTRSQNQILMEVEAVVDAVQAVQNEANRRLLSSEKTFGPISSALRHMEHARLSITDLCEMVREMAEQMAVIKDECQAYTLGVQAGVRMVLDMLTEERQAMLMRGSPYQGKGTVDGANLLAKWIELFHARVKKQHGIGAKEEGDG